MSHVSLGALAQIRTNIRNPASSLSRRRTKHNGLLDVAGLLAAIERAAEQFERPGAPTTVTRLEFSAGDERWALKRAANGEWQLEPAGKARRGAPARASDAEVKAKVFRVRKALECVSSVMRSEEGAWSAGNRPDDVLRRLMEHPIAHW